MAANILELIQRFQLPAIRITDIVEVLLLAVGIYYILLWLQNTKAWILLKGAAVLGAFTFLAYILHLDTIYWLANKVLGFGITALLIIFQPELRRALEGLGTRRYFGDLNFLETSREVGGLFSDKTLNEIVKATFEMAKVRTGALIVIQRSYALTEYERTGITLDSIVSSQLLINIFEHNTPLHDGAVIINGDRIVSATCYLPLSDNMGLEKDLGTRHRAGVGISEATDSFTIIVSEETGGVSVATDGKLERHLDAARLKDLLKQIQNKTVEQKRFAFWKGKVKDGNEGNE